MTSDWIGVFGVAALGLAWVAVQRAWARSFPDAFSDPDVLAGRSGCSGCGCVTPCRRDGGPAPSKSEETNHE